MCIYIIGLKNLHLENKTQFIYTETSRTGMQITIFTSDRPAIQVIWLLILF